MLFSQTDQDRITDGVRELLAAGYTLGDAIREMYRARGVGLLWLARAVAAACGMPLKEAQRAVIRETFDLRNG